MTSPDPRLAYGGLPAMVWTAGLDRRCDYVNQRWLQFTGRRLEEELGEGWADRVHPDDRDATLAEHQAAFESRRPFDVEYRLRRADGEYRWLASTAVLRTGADREFAGYVACCTDVTDRRALEQRIKQLERAGAIAQLAGGIAHDFNNLLTGIIGHCSLLQEDHSLSLEARSDLAQIQRSADRAAGLTRQLLAFSRRQVLAPRILDLNRLVAGTVSAIRGVAGGRIDVLQILAADLPPVLADSGQVEQILLQLGTHAREAMPDGGRLELRTAAARVDPALAARHHGLVPGDYVTLTVSDTGRSMEPDALAHVFDPSFSGKPIGQGLGLGLASVYGAVKQCGGYIAVESRPGEGTAFTIYLPRRGSGAVGSGREVSDGGRGTETVLLVEDEEQVRELTRRVLERAGYTVLAARDAESAVAMADRHPGEIHLLVTDMMLPRVSGRELAARLGIHRPAIKVLYISGTSDNAISRHRMLEPGTQFLEKPFSLERLLQKVRQALGAPDPAPRPA
ncbi:MAG TPA: PAS domain-containing protein [Gemmatimonadales bacterium]|nr:PAS domain-containing protein [Gemmatimonadales bacterium]